MHMCMTVTVYHPLDASQVQRDIVLAIEFALLTTLCSKFSSQQDPACVQRKIAETLPMVCAAAQPQAKAVPVTMNEMLLRGCTLKNTGHILGLAIYTGNETRIQKNSAKTPNKIGGPSPLCRQAAAKRCCRCGVRDVVMS